MAADQTLYMEMRAKAVGLGQRAQELSKHVTANADEVCHLAAAAADAQLRSAFAHAGSTPGQGLPLSGLAAQAMREGWLEADQGLVDALWYVEEAVDAVPRGVSAGQATDAMDANNYLAEVLRESGLPFVRADIPDECFADKAAAWKASQEAQAQA